MKINPTHFPCYVMYILCIGLYAGQLSDVIASQSSQAFYKYKPFISTYELGIFETDGYKIKHEFLDDKKQIKPVLEINSNEAKRNQSEINLPQNTAFSILVNLPDIQAVFPKHGGSMPNQQNLITNTVHKVNWKISSPFTRALVTSNTSVDISPFKARLII